MPNLQVPTEIVSKDEKAMTLGGLVAILTQILTENPHLSTAPLVREHGDHYDRVKKYGILLFANDEEDELAVSFDFDPETVDPGVYSREIKH